MKKTFRTKSSNNRIISFAMILGLFVVSLSGCQQVNNVVNGNTATNANTTANTNTATNSNTAANTIANSNANSSVTANSNANSYTSVVPSDSAVNTNNQASNTANTAIATKEEIPLTPEAKVFKNDLVGKWKIKNTNQEVTFAADNYEVKGGNSVVDKGSYRVLDEKTVEINSLQQNKKWNATMKIMNSGDTLDWQQSGGSRLTLDRVKP